MGATVQFVGLEVKPKLPGIAPDACVIRADRATVRGAPLDQMETTQLRVTLDNALVDFDCFPAEVRPMIGLMGVNDLDIDRLDVFVSYHMPSGSGNVQFQAGIEGLVRILGDIDLDYISYRMNFETEKSEPAAMLNSARIQIEDRGLVARSQQILPPDLRDPAQLAEVVRTNMSQMMVDAAGQLSAAQKLFVNDAAALAQTIAEGGKRAVLETNIALQNPDALFDALAPRISAAPLALDSTLSLSLLEAASEGELRGEEALAVGRGLALGVGAPRNIALALKVLEPLADDEAEEMSAQASFLMAQALGDGDPEQGYVRALKSAAAGHGPALALMDGIENTLSFQVVMDRQDELLPEDSLDPEQYASIGEMRAAALGHMIGTGKSRSYKAAYFWAVLAAAAGDTSAAALRDELDTRMRVRGLATEWGAVTRQIEADVLDAWTASDMPARLKSQ